MHWQIYIREQGCRMYHAALGLCGGHPSTAGAFFSDKSGKKYQKPTSRTQDGQLIQQLLSKKKSFRLTAAKQNNSQ